MDQVCPSCGKQFAIPSLLRLRELDREQQQDSELASSAQARSAFWPTVGGLTLVVLIGVSLAWSMFRKNSSDGKRLQGSWIGVSAEQDGESIIDTLKPRFIFKGDSLVMEGKTDYGEQTLMDAKFVLYTTDTPKKIDIAPEHNTYSGIYALESDTLTVCLPNPPGTGRPSDFTTEPGSKRLLLVFRRESPDVLVSGN
jgi:uncharacterized protein (TIGR03067 family)